MRTYILRLLSIFGCILFFTQDIQAQGFSFNCARDTMVPGCPANLCITLKTLIPDPYRQASTYAVGGTGQMPSCLLASNNPGIPGAPTTLNIDDRYSPAFPIGFPFIFFGSPYNDLVVSSNGYICFDITRANQFSHWNIINGGTPQNLPSTFYDKALIMGPYHDIDIGVTTSPTRLISYQTAGLAPYRKWILNYYKIPLFSGACNNLFENTHQIILYESTGIIDVNIFDKQICPTWNQGRAMVGVQDMNRTTGVMAPGRYATDPPWGSVGMNESWRFTPTGGTPLFRRVELYDMSNNLLATGTTTPLPTGDRDVSFPNICAPAGASTQYVIKAFYDKIDDPTVEIYATDTIAINRGNPLTGIANTTAANCGTSNGSIDVTGVAGGVAPYEYSLDGVTWQPGNSFSGLPSGTYTVYIRDNGATCTRTITPVVIGTTGNIPAASTSTPAACTGVNNGSITITSAGGTGPYTFSLDGGAAVPGTIPFTFSNLAPGAHTVKVNDVGTGCSSVVMNFNITTGTGVTATSNTVATTCAGVNNGTITVTATAGTAPFTWQLDAAAAVPGASPYTFTNIAAGAHTIIITDAAGCTRTLNVNVATGTGVTATSSTTPTACAAAANGSITINATTGTAPYTWQLDAGASQNGANPYTFSNVASGAHTVLITDANGCTRTLNVNVAAGPGINGNASTAATSCPAATDGSITATATTGTAPYTWQLDGAAAVPGASPYTYSGVPSGAHTVTITDANGCSVTLNVNVAAGAPLNANANGAATSCSGATNGSIIVTPTNGTGPYQYSLDGGAAVAGGASYTFNNIPAGPHTVIVTDASGCVTAPIPVTVVAGPQMVTTATSNDVLCNGGATGSITVATPAIGTAPFQYSLDNITWQGSNVFNGLAAGTYTVYYRESNGCQNSLTIVVNEPAALASSAATVAAVCNAQNNGIITLTTVGGVGPYDYSIDGGTTWQSANVFNVGAGTYTITIRDFNGCITSQTVTVTEPAPLTASSLNSDASCDGGNDGVITVNAAGGNTSYTYSIDGVNFQASNVFNVAPGNYTITVKDNLGCSTTFNTAVGLSNNLAVTPQTDPTICESKSVQLNLASNATVYTWTPSTGLSSTTVPNPVANPVVTTQYIVTATLGRCSANDTVIVNVNAAPIPDAGPDGNICYGQTYQLQGNGGVQYTWTPSTYLDNPNIASPVSTPAKTITYTLSQIIDANGCKSLTTDNVTIDVTPPIKVTTFPYDTVGYPGDQIQFNTFTNVPNIANYTWTPSIGLNNPNIKNPTVTVGPVGSDVLYQVITTTAQGCKGEGYVKLRVYNGPELYVPSAFSPNGDGLNETFYPFPVGIRAITYFKVYNRWGQLLFSSTTLYKGWDGKYLGVEQPSGAYVFMAQGVDKNGRLHTKQGTVTLIR